MALDNKNDRTITDLKAAFFDLFLEHTGDIVGMIEALATGNPEDAVNIETSIFQRIILLNKTANNVNSLGKNVLTLNSLKIEESVKMPTKSNNREVKATSNDNKVINTPTVDNKVVNTPTVDNKAVNTPTASKDNSISEPSSIDTSVSNELSSAPSTVNTSNQVIPATNHPTPPAPVSEPVKSVDSSQKTQSVIPPKVELPEPAKNSPLEKKEEPGSVNEKNSKVAENKKNSEPSQLLKMSDKKAKAILVNKKQYDKLTISRQSQFQLLDFGVYSSETVESRIDYLMKKASSLYKEGKVSEAQAMYAEISALNKKLNQEHGRDKLLIKKAA